APAPRRRGGGGFFSPVPRRGEGGRRPPRRRPRTDSHLVTSPPLSRISWRSGDCSPASPPADGSPPPCRQGGGAATVFVIDASLGGPRDRARSRRLPVGVEHSDDQPRTYFGPWGGPRTRGLVRGRCGLELCRREGRQGRPL